MHKCEICEKECADNQGRQYSPSDLNAMEPKVADQKAVVIQSMATSIIMFNNPPGAANQPMWWICQQCAGRCYLRGRTADSVKMDQSIFNLFAGKKRKKWWEFWK